MIPIDSIKIPRYIQRLCEGWAGSEDCMLRAVSSTGGLTLGTIRPSGCDTKEKWYYHIWMEFASDLSYARVSFKYGDEDADQLNYAEEWACNICMALAEAYGLEDWDASDD